MSKININISEGDGCNTCGSGHHSDHKHHKAPDAHNNEEGRMHRTNLAQLHAKSLKLLSMIEDQDDLPEWVESKITKAADYISSIENYLNGNLARDVGALEEDIIEEDVFCEVDTYFNLYEAVQDAVTEDSELTCPQCLYEILHDAACDCSEMISEAEYRGRKVKLNKPMRGDVKKFKVYVKDPKTGNIKKVNFGHGGSSARKKGQKTMRIRKSNKKARKSFRARHNCKNPGPKTKARYWSCRKW
tara:strand:+ start:4741 stop:5475 length:735 start_codon:yes stop_codon:yes gene_type:complete